MHTDIETGLREHQQGNIASAKAAYERALALAPDNPDAQGLLGLALLQLGEPGQAVDWLERAARRQRNNPSTQGNLAHAYFALQRYAAAEAAFRKAGRLNPREMQFALGTANSLAMQGKLVPAEALLRKLTERTPQQALPWFNLGNVLRDQQRGAAALECYRKATELDPHLVDARNNLASALHSLLRLEEAEHEFRVCLRLAPDYVPVRCNLASVIIDLGRFREAEELCRTIIGLAPDLALAHTFLGAALSHQGRLLESLECHRAAAKLAPQQPKVAENYASTLTDTGCFSEALKWFSRARALNPDSISVGQALSLALLRHGCLAEGWAEYGSRPSLTQFREKNPHLALTRTLPPDLSGKHLCVLREQGLGDEFFFLRFAPPLKAAGARITYRASAKIHSLLTRAACLERVLEQTHTLPAADAVMLAGDLPHALDTSPACPLPCTDKPDGFECRRKFASRVSVFWPEVPAPLALAPLETRLASLRTRLAAAGNPPYLGVTWRGGVPPREQRGVTWTLYKEIGIPQLGAALKDYPGSVIALQRNPAAAELAALSQAIGRQVHDFTALNEDLEDMLALLALIDEYVGVSNTNMHLRAAAGKMARVLVPCPSEWRWMETGKSSPWFPGFMIYRQSLRGEWGAALAALQQDLALT